MSTTTTPETEQLANQVETFLLDALETFAEEWTIHDQHAGPGRPRILSSTLLWTAFVLSVVRGFRSQRDVWRQVSRSGVGSVPPIAVCDQTVYNRLAAGGTAPLAGLFEQVSRLLASRLRPHADRGLASFASAVIALDSTMLDPVARKLPVLRPVPKGDLRTLGGQLLSSFDLRIQQWRQVIYRPEAQENEKKHARELLADLPRGSLLLADLGFFGFAWFDELTAAGHFWVSRMRNRTSYQVLHTFSEDEALTDQVIWLGVYRADRAAHAVRLIQIQRGQQTWRYLTNVLDPRLFSAREVADLYARRWDIEMAFKLLKRDLQLHLLWSAKEEVIVQQVWGALIVAQIMLGLRQEIAVRAKVDPFDVSLELLVRWYPRLMQDGLDPLEVFVNDGRRLAFIRPSRRITIQVPEVASERIAPLPPELVLKRKARYARRKCGPRAKIGK